MALWLQDMYIWLGFSPEAAKLIARVQGLDGPKRPQLLIDENVDDICNAVRKSGGKNAN